MWQIESDIAPLNAVLLHTPGKELENLIPKYLEDLLFDEIPWLSKAQEEHRGFAKVLQKNGVEVLYLLDLMEDIIADKDIKKQVVKEHLAFSRPTNKDIQNAIYNYLWQLPHHETLKILTSGLRKEEIAQFKTYKTLSDLTVSSYPFYLDPLPSMYFTRDHGAMINNGLFISSMFNYARRRETIFLRFLQRYHPLFKKQNVNLWFDEEIPTGIEGGDIILLNESTLCIGLSERTTENAIEYVAHQFLIESNIIKNIVVIEIPAKRAYMHLDTVFTMIDYDKFLMYPGIADKITVYKLYRGAQGKVVASYGGSLQATLAEVLNVSYVNILYSGDGHPITAAREQWADSTNTLTIAPGVVVTYNRNEATNKLLRRNGIQVLEIEGSELVRGRGGPRCMSMPLYRK